MKKDRHDVDLNHLRSTLRYCPATGIFSWYDASVWGHRPSGIAGSITNRGYMLVTYQGWRHMAHRLAWFYIRGEWPDGEIDHKDGDKLNNSLENLRNVGRSENLQNRSASPIGEAGSVAGCYQDRRTGKWWAAIKINRKSIMLGSHATKAEAHQAYLDAKLKLHPASLRAAGIATNSATTLK